MVEVCLPGTGGVLPLENRWTASCWVEFQGTAVLIDCGEGTQIALKKADCRLSRLGLLLITHFHADHIAGLPGLLLTLGNYGKKTPLTIAGPVGLEQIVTSLMTIVPNLPYPVVLNELDEEAQDFELFGIHFASMYLQHGVPCLGYRMTFKRKPIFNPNKAKELGVPLYHYKTLHAGQSVVLDNGSLIVPSMVLDGERPPISICYCTDTQSVEEISRFAHDADLFICEGMYGENAQSEKMWKKGHMVFSDSAGLAKSAEVKQLWLTHFSPAMKYPERYLDAARCIFRYTEVGYDGIRTTL
ncbi:ribonuclease Z [Caproiciproducens sp. R1]|uniref:ribonuclease Z n=1 Tax=Caproiciproducens sp. R1 TaxID=3435000 RepID=UPI004033FF90